MAWPVQRANGFLLDATAWNEVIAALSAWGGDVNAGTHNLSNLGVLTFGAGGYAASLGVGRGGPWVPAVISTVSGPPSLNCHDANGHLSLNCSGGQEMVFGFYPTSPYAAWIQTRHDWSAGLYYPIALNPLGGNFGIGTPSPDYLLDVGYISSTVSNSLRVGSGAGYDSSLLLREASDGYGFTFRNIHGSGLGILRHNGDPTGVSALYITRAEGNVNIGLTANYAARLAVDMDSSRLYMRRGGGNGWGVRIDGSGTLILAYESDAGATVGTVPMKYSYDGYLSQAIKGAAADAFLDNGHYQLFVSEAGKTVSLRYKDSGGVCHTVTLGTWT